MKTLTRRDVLIPIGSCELQARFSPPSAGRALVMFAHGSGSSRLSPRNRFVADQLVRHGFGTLLLDLLTPDEDRVYENRFDMLLLSTRLMEAVHWARSGQIESSTPIAFFGASTGAAASLIAASELEANVWAVVSRGGRPDLAGAALRRVTCPTLLIVGGSDLEVIDLNRSAMSHMVHASAVELSIVPSATHLFEEPGALARVSELALNWLKLYATRRP